MAEFEKGYISIHPVQVNASKKPPEAKELIVQSTAK